MGLISRKAAIDAAKHAWAKGLEPSQYIEIIPTVPAVPLDKLCEWLNVHCGRPNYCNDRLCGKCNLDGEGYEYETCWKTLLTEWMEEQDADRQ